MSEIQELAYLQIPLDTIKLATNNFSDQNFIGWGGFGKVYKGRFPHPISRISTTVAVKRLDVNSISSQGRNEFLKEIVALASYKHENIVSLLGFCDKNGEKILVYEHEVNGSLDKHLAGTDLTWAQRLRICLDAACGLKYLHDDVGAGHRVIHCDIKSSNILLDENWKAKISDFGLCKVGPRNEQFSFLVTNAVGTIGYVDPQYCETGVLTKASDVYAFGVVLCEVMCGRLAVVAKCSDTRKYLPHLVKRRYKDGNVYKVILASLREHMNPYSLDTFSTIAYHCLQKDRRDRPIMEIVVKELEAALEHQIGSLGSVLPALPERRDQPVCQYYINTGYCKFGAACRYHHPEWVPTTLTPLSSMGYPLRPGEPLCTFYSRYGSCWFGEECQFDHSMQI